MEPGQSHVDTLLGDDADDVDVRMAGRSSEDVGTSC